MVCAILSAVYDHDSDWTYGNRKGQNFKNLLHLVEAEDARDMADRLFAKDVGHQLSKHGLERGSVALRFYWLVIKCQWMKGYTAEQVDEFGRKLQILDDLLDFEDDRVAGDTNCLLTNEAGEYITEGTEFLESEFFSKLKENSKIYRVLERKAHQLLKKFSAQKVTFGQLWQIGRPTTGAYAFITTLIGFGYYDGAPWVVRLLTASAFAGLTMSIMVYNDWVDRGHDRKKWKMFASEHPQEVFRWWINLSAITTVLVMLVATYNPLVAYFCLLVWGVGTLYSHIPHWYIVQNVVVAICAGSPALCGLVYHRQVTTGSLATFLMFSTLLFISEVYKDVEDSRVDEGYKATMPVKLGHRRTVLRLFSLCFLAALVMAIHPNPWVWKIAIVGLPLLQYNNAEIFCHPQYIARPKGTLRWILKILLIVLILT